MKNNFRRQLLKNGILSTTALLVAPRVLQAQSQTCAKSKTPAQAEGPFYPVVDQLDTDADLINLKGSQKFAKGQVVMIQGVVTDQNCQPVKSVLVEIWQACHTGKYDHPSDPNPAAIDPDFQYWGKALTNDKGEYRFRTIVPGAYQADRDWVRPPHVHFKISKLGYMELITQMYFAGHTLNSRDKILQRLPKTEQEKLIVYFNNRQGSQHPTGQFNIQIEKI
jgi:protocatechuate 3,4-dioxygenase beta subunit